MKRLLVVFAIAAAFIAPAAAAQRTLTLIDMRQTVSFSSIRISPDGRFIAAIESRGDYDKDTTHRTIVLVDVNSRAIRVLVRDGGVQTLAWSPNGDAIAYVAPPRGSADAPGQLFVLPMNGGEPEALTDEKNGVGNIAWRPDGRALAFSSQPPPENQKALDHHENPFNVTEEAWTAQEATPLTALYEVDRRFGAKPRRIGGNALNVGGGFTYASDGKSIFVTRVTPGARPEQYLSREIVRITVSGGATTQIARIGPSQRGPVRSLDGRALAFGFGDPRGTMQNEVAIADSDGQHPRWVSSRLNRDVNGLAFAPGGTLLVTANDGTRSRLYALAAGSIQTLPLGDIDAASDPSAARNGAIVFAGRTPSTETELYLLSPRSRQPVQLTNVNRWLDRFAIGRHRTIVWRTKDGMLADGVLIYPPQWKAGMRAPLVLVIHGGPTAASLQSFDSLGDVFAANGWFVFEPNYRGSDDLGVAFARTTVPHIASVPGDDIERGLSAVLALNLVDPSRIGVSGWSEGGLMTSWLITHDTRWKAAVSGAAVNDWLGYSAMTDAKDFTPQFIARDPWANPDAYALYRDESPLTYASRVKTPTLILSDSSDYRVPTPLAYEFYHEVRATGTPVEFVVWPVVGHFPRDPVRVEDILTRWQAWLVKYL